MHSYHPISARTGDMLGYRQINDDNESLRRISLLLGAYGSSGNRLVSSVVLLCMNIPSGKDHYVLESNCNTLAAIPLECPSAQGRPLSVFLLSLEWRPPKAHIIVHRLETME